MLFRRATSPPGVPCKFSRKTRPIANLCCEFHSAEEIVRNQWPTLLFFYARRWPARSTDKSSAPITAAASEIACDDRPPALSPHAHARLLRLRAPGGLHARRRASG